MAKLRIDTGIPALDGEYELDVSYFTNRELHTIKKLSGLRAGELEESFSALDNDLVVALAVIARERAGKPGLVELLWDAPVGKVSLDFSEEEQEDDALPPASRLFEASSQASESDSSSFSGSVSSAASAPSESDPSLTGSPR